MVKAVVGANWGDEGKGKITDMLAESADYIVRFQGGANAGRPRRMGWFDCVASKYGCRMQGTTDVAFTVLDVLGYLLEKAKPVFKVLPGWKCEIRGIKEYDKLPENCKKYVEFIEEQIGYPITMISNGPGRDDIIWR